jgi:hypothetical protein
MELIQTIPGSDYSLVHKRYENHDGVIVDLGCSTWDWSSLFIGKKRIIGVDPQEDAIENTEIFKGIIGPINGSARLKGEGWGAEVSKDDQGVLYDMISWKSLCEKYNIKSVSILKINIEGSEYSLLKSMDVDDFEKIDQIAVSFHDWLHPNQKQQKDECISLLENMGYQVRSIYPSLGWYLALKKT